MCIYRMMRLKRTAHPRFYCTYLIQGSHTQSPEIINFLMSFLPYQNSPEYAYLFHIEKMISLNYMLGMLQIKPGTH